MNRLTFEGNFCDIALCAEAHCTEPCSQRKTWERLKEYEDAEAEGRLIVLPCKVGDTVYAVDGDEESEWIDEYEVKYFYCSSRGVNRIYATCGTLTKNFRPKRIGKEYFLSREEAEAALKNADK